MLSSGTGDPFSWPDAGFLPYVIFAVGFWGLIWSFGRYTSSFLLGVRQARTLQLAAAIAICALPVPILITLLAPASFENAGLWHVWILYPLIQQSSGHGWDDALMYGGVLMVTAIVIAFMAEGNLVSRLAKLNRARAEADLAAA